MKQTYRTHDSGVREVFSAADYAERIRAITPDHRPMVATCGACGRSWDDAVITGCTPAPSGRCPFEYEHRYCDVCDESITDDDMHTNDETGGDCHGACCPTCNEAPTACMICNVAEADIRVMLQLLVELQVESLLPAELAALNRLQRAVGA